MKERIYVCHTYYHVYVTFLKELNLPKEQRGKATLLLSKMSIDFENLKERVESTGLFEEGVKRYCKHSGLEYAGILAERHLGYDVEFMDDEKRNRAEVFARGLMERME